MVKRVFTVKAVWDPEARVYWCDSDIEGLHIEAETLDDFEGALFDLAPELIVANHLSPEDLSTRPLTDLMPAIIWRRPDETPAAA